jgi:hypothetical protein
MLTEQVEAAAVVAAVAAPLILAVSLLQLIPLLMQAKA